MVVGRGTGPGSRLKGLTGEVAERARINTTYMNIANRAVLARVDLQKYQLSPGRTCRLL